MTQIDRDRRRYGAGVAALLAALLVPVAAQVAEPSAAATIVKYAADSSVVISEVSCEADWIELANTDTKLPARIANWFIADSAPLVSKSSYRFGKAAVIKPGARVVVKVSSLPFKIGCGSDNVYLNRTATAIVDRVTVPNLNPGFTWGRVDGKWQANLPTMAKANVAAPTDAVVDRAAWLYDPLKAYAISLTVESATLQELVKTPKQYVAAQFQMIDSDGNKLPEAGPLQVGLRVKGSIGTLTRASYGPNGLNIVDDKVSLKVKFNFSVKGQTFFGLKKMTFNSMVEDPTMTHETLAYKLFRSLGVIAPRTGFANISINGSLRGLFLNLEPYDDISMAWHLPAMQHVYEGQTTLAGADPVWVNPDFTKSALTAAFFVDEGSETDRSDLAALIAGMQAAISAEPDSVTLTPRAMPATLTSHLNVEELGRFFAAEKFMNHFDGYSGSVPWAPNNFYLVDDMQGRFQFMPWGTDVTWRLVPGEEGLDSVGRQPFDRGTGLAFRVCLRDDRCASAYRVGLATAAALASSWRAFAEQLVDVHQASRLADTLRRTTEGDLRGQWSLMRDFFPDQETATQQYLKSVVTGALRWQPTSLKIAKGAALSAQHFNAYSDVAGSFSYSVPLGTKLTVGKHDVTVTFTPADASAPVQTAKRTFTVG